MIRRSILAIGGVAILLMTADARAVGEGLEADITSVDFQYTATNPNAGPGEVIGTISITDGLIGGITFQQLDLGADGLFDGVGPDADTIIDFGMIYDAANFDMQFVADVVFNNSNDYSLGNASILVTDTVTTLASPSFSGAASQSGFSFSGGLFVMEADLSPLAGNDAILEDIGGPWYYEGDSADTPDSPNQDSIDGRVSLISDRDLFDEARLGHFHFGGTGIADLDQYFSQNRSNSLGDIKMAIAPEPGTLALMSLIVAGFVMRRR